MVGGWLRICLGLWLLVPAAVKAGEPEPAAPVLSAAGPRQPVRVEVLSDGLALEVRDALVERMIGPICPGELHFSGSFVPALLPPASRKEVARRLPQAWSRQRAGSAPPPADTDRLLVVIDPGHGGSEEGCRGVAGTLEKRLVLQISQRIQSLLEQLPSVQVIMTRQRDEHISLWDRVDLANQLDADLFISVHANAFVRPDFGGVETFFHSLEASDEEARRVARAENAPQREKRPASRDRVQSILADMRRAETLRDSSRFAHLVQLELARVLPFDNLGVKQADFVVLRGTRMPSVLLELGFLTNAAEERVLLRERIQSRIAQAVRMAVINYRRLLQRKRVAPEGRQVSRP
jgi:N-acetylmuramoyl-L-alanine amidase